MNLRFCGKHNVHNIAGFSLLVGDCQTNLLTQFHNAQLRPVVELLGFCSDRRISQAEADECN